MFHNEGENKNMSVAEYFYTQYEIKLKFPNLPCVLVNRDIFLPIELCHVLPGKLSKCSKCYQKNFFVFSFELTLFYYECRSTFRRPIGGHYTR
jgi:hypothetical protein